MADASPPKPRGKGGRPSQGKNSGAFKFRVTASLREKLQAEAEAVGRPVSEVVEGRLEQSFRSVPDPYLSAALKMATANCLIVQELFGKNIVEDEYILLASIEAVRNAFNTVAVLGRPKTDKPVPAESLDLARELIRPDAELLGANVSRLVALFREGRGEAYEASKQVVERLVEKHKDPEAYIERYIEEQVQKRLEASRSKT